ncbi:GDSL esterase/lipase [Rhynchospora pubera]|uniref:GDSL esterase/lipase n=1 Tax=Rhynchospora pubera TaxID=906938 RepID=A0AAV8C9J1_9POAL|nr:GDSL esterase/lipase [Rhynchospora pubera]
MNAVLLQYFLLLILFLHHASSNSVPVFNAIYSFGASYEDTGNLAILSPTSNPMKLPYGETFFDSPTGRASDGRLVIDRIASYLGLSFIPPSLAQGQDFSKGANFAVYGTTTLNLSFFQKNKIRINILKNTTLSVQLEWFENQKPSICKCNTTCMKFFTKSLFMLGKFGVNDYLSMLFAGKTIDFINSTIPLVVKTIRSAAERLLRQGVMHLVVAGIIPTGCSPVILTYFASTNRSDYDSLGCLQVYNNIGMYHNDLLSDAVKQLRVEFPRAKISFVQYYEPIIDFLRNPRQYGFTSGTELLACCGKGEPYNFNLSTGCGQIGVPACQNPSTFINWDGLHLTDTSYKIIADGWWKGPYADPPISGFLIGSGLNSVKRMI